MIKGKVKKRRELLVRLLNLLYKKYPDYEEEKKLQEFKDILPEALGITAPIPTYTNKVNDINFLANISQIRQTNLVELLPAVYNEKSKKLIAGNRYRITIKGIEFINQVTLTKSSNRLEILTIILIIFTSVLIATKPLYVSLDVLAIVIVIAIFYFIFMKVYRMIM